MIEFNNVTKVYPNGTVGIKNVSMKINDGEFVFIVGSSGSGKSTIIKLILKELDVSSGTIYVNNQNITKMKRREIPYLRRKIGVVFQDFRLLPNKTIFENVAFALRVVEAPGRDIRRNVPMVLSMVGLSKKTKSYPHQLSGGEQQRTALARAIVNTPSILIADEPTGNLDPATSWEIAKLLSDINARGSTVLVATHAKQIVDQMKKRVIYLSDGELKKDKEKGVYGYEV